MDCVSRPQGRSIYEQLQWHPGASWSRLGGPWWLFHGMRPRRLASSSTATIVLDVATKRDKRNFTIEVEVLQSMAAKGRQRTHFVKIFLLVRDFHLSEGSTSFLDRSGMRRRAVVLSSHHPWIGLKTIIHSLRNRESRKRKQSLHRQVKSLIFAI